MDTFAVKTLDQTKSLAEAFAPLLRQGDVIALYGTLGVGKTAFTRFVVQALCGQNEEVPSPTFTLLQTYDTDNFTIFHFDLYRLKKPDEVLELGIEDAFYDGVSLVEWPERMGGYLPTKKVLKINISVENDIHHFIFLSENQTWKERLSQWNVKI